MVHCRGALSGRKRIRRVPWRKRPAETWSNDTSTTSSGRTGCQSPLRSLDQIRADILKLEQQTEGLLQKIVGGVPA